MKSLGSLESTPLAQARTRRWDVVVIGAGHNGLVSALVLARAGLSVLVIEGKPVIGGAVRTERPFANAPNLPTSTGAYLLGLMPPELLRELGLSLPLIRRDPHYFLPTTGRRYLLLGSNGAAVERQLGQFFSERDWRAHQALEGEIAALRDDIAASWMSEPLSIEETAERYVRPELRRTFVALCRGSVGEYLQRFDFESDLIKAMYAVTDGFSGLFGAWDTPGTGMNFLVHNMCRLPGSDGTWMVVQGGMGTVTETIAGAFSAAGGSLLVSQPVAAVPVEQGTVRGVVLEDGTEIRASIVVANCDPFTLRDLVGEHTLPIELNRRLDGYKRPGSTLKLNLALERLPEFRCLPENRGQFRTTIHLLPDGPDVLAQLDAAFQAAKDGRLPEFPSIEWYMHTPVDGTLTDECGRISSALFVQWVPYEIRGSSWDAEVERYSDHLLSICDRFAPGTSSLVVGRFPLHPKAIESHFGIRYGHIHHVDNSFGFADRFPHALPIAGLYSASAGTHPAGSVIGCAGYLAAQCVLRDLGRTQDR